MTNHLAFRVFTISLQIPSISDDSFFSGLYHILICIPSQNKSWVLQDISILFLNWDLIYFILHGNSEILEHNRFGFFDTSVIKTKVFSQPAPYSGIQAAHFSPGCLPMQPTWKEGKWAGVAQKLLRFCSRIRGTRQVFQNTSIFLITEKTFLHSELFIRDSL